MEEGENRKLSSVIFLCLSMLGAIINIILLLCIQRNPLKCFRNCSSYLVAHQAISDVITCLAVASYCIAMINGDSEKLFFDAIPKTFVVLSFTAFVALFLVSLDRFLAIRFPIKYRIYVRPSRLPLVLLPIWLCTFLLIVIIIKIPTLHHRINKTLMYNGVITVFLKLCLHALAFWTIKQKGKQLEKRNFTFRGLVTIRYL